MKTSKKSFGRYLLLLPCFATIILTVIYPIIRTFLFSMQNFNLTDPTNKRFVGIENYVKVFNSPNFYVSLRNSFFVLIITMIFSLISSLAVGILLNRKNKLSPIITGIAIIPWALPPLVNGIIWKFVFYPGYGLMNRALINIGVIDSPVQWTNGVFMTLFVVSIVVCWKVVPFCAVLILSGIQSIPKELYEAAKVDGSNRFNSFTKITLPLLIPSLSIVMIQISMVALNVFDEVVSISGYRLDSSTLLIYNYMNTFSYLDFGYGSAITYVIMILSGVVGFFYIRSVGEVDER